MGVGFILKGYSFDAIITARRPSSLRWYETLTKGGLDDPSNVFFSGFVELDEIHVPAIEIVMNETSIHSSFLVIYVGPLIPQGCGQGGFSRRRTSSIQNKGSSPPKRAIAA